MYLLIPINFSSPLVYATGSKIAITTKITVHAPKAVPIITPRLLVSVSVLYASLLKISSTHNIARH